MQNKNIILPSFLTICNIFCGFLAITQVIEGDILIGAWLIVLAVFFDTIDGKVAKLTKSTSFFGIEFDSLADMISFGVATSLLIYQAYLKTLGFIGIFLCFIYLVFGAFRLARFNIQYDEVKSNYYYNGLPITFSALVLSTLMIFSYDIWGDFRFTGFLIILLLGLSVLMISQIKYETIRILNFLEGKPFKLKSILFYILVLILAIFPRKAIFPFSLLFVLLGIMRSLLIYIRKEEKTVEV